MMRSKFSQQLSLKKFQRFTNLEDTVIICVSGLGLNPGQSYDNSVSMSYSGIQDKIKQQCPVTHPLDSGAHKVMLLK